MATVVLAPEATPPPPGLTTGMAEAANAAPAPVLRGVRPAVRSPGPRAIRRTYPTHEDLLAADRRLRRAYALAVNAGVPQPVLVDYRNRWADLRHQAGWRPDRVASGYAAMAGDLTRMSYRRRVQSPRRHPLRDRRW